MHISRTIQGRAVPLARNKKPWQLTGMLLAAAVIWCCEPTQASVVEFTGGPTTTQSDGEVYFSPLTGQVWTSYSDSALFGIANVSGNLAITFNATPDGTLVVTPNTTDPSLSTVARLSSGAVIGSSSVFDNTEYTLAESDGLIGNWNALGSGFFGFRFGTGADVHYGWAAITVRPDFNITLNSFAYETVSGQSIVTAAPVPEPSSFALLAVLSVLALLFGIRRRFSRRAQWASVAAGLVAASTVLPAQTSTQPVPGQTDPVGSHLMQFRSDHLFSITENLNNASNTALNTFGVQYSSNPFGISLNDTSYTTQTSTVSGRQYHAVSGRFLQPDHDDVVIAYVDGSNINVQIVGKSAANVTLPTSVLPRYVATLPNGSTQPTVDFVAMAAGDLDHAVDSSGNYHDEAVIAYVTGQNTYDLVVLDFSANVADPSTGNLTTIYPPKSVEFQALEGLQFNPAMMINSNSSQSPPGHVLPYDNIVSVSVGDFDGDGVAEIAVAAINYQPSQDNNPDTTLAVQTLRYRPELQTVFEIGLSPPVDLPLIQEGSNLNQTAYLGANLTMTSGDYEGRGADDVALGYIAYGPPLQSNEAHEVYPTSVINLLNAAPGTKVVQAFLHASDFPGSPSTLELSGITAGSIPQQLTISSAQDSSNDTAWNILIGTWQTTLTSSPNPGDPVRVSIPVDTSQLPEGAGQITVLISTPLGLAPGNTPLQNALPKFNNSSPDDYPKLQLVSGLFKYDPTNGWDFSRRQLAAVWNSPRCCNPTTYTINAAWYSVSGTQPQFSQEGINAIETKNGPEAAQFFTVTAGAFRGNTVINSDGAFNHPPIWSLAINAWYTDSQDLIWILEPDGNGGFWVDEQSFAVSQVDRQARLAVVNYDPDGSSVYLGAPIHLTISNLVTPTAIIKQPPQHLAWFQDLSNCPTINSPYVSSGPGMCNVNRSGDFNVQFEDASSNLASTTTQQQNSSDFSQSQTTSASASVKDTIFPGAYLKVSTSDTTALSTDTSKTYSSYYSSSGQLSYDAGAATDQDDLLEEQVQNLDVWRYRVYSADSTTAAENTFYDLTYPTFNPSASAVRKIVVAGLGNDWYNPVHENGNILSYSPLPSSGLPDDVGQPYKVNGQLSSNAVLFSGTEFCYGGTIAKESITMTGVSDKTDTVETAKTNSWDEDMKVGDTVKVEGAKISASADVDLGQSQSLSQSTASENTTTGSKGVTLNMIGGNDIQEYGISPVFYNTDTGVLKFQQYVSIPTGRSNSSDQCPSQTGWWTDYYGGAPDPALNLPYRFTAPSNQNTETATWSLNTDVTREQLRSFFLTSATGTTGQNEVGTPLATNPAEGTTVTMTARVYNFSLQPTAQNQNVTVQFSVVPYDSSHDNELGCGTPASGETGRYCAPNVRTVLGTATIASIPGWGSASNPNWAMASYPWTIPSGFIAANGNSPEFRIYVNLLYGGTELNPAQAPCNNSPASNPERCPSQIGATSSASNWDPNAPGQNNEGYSYITLQPAQGPSTSSELTVQNVRAARILRAAVNGAPLHPTSPHNLKTTPDSLAAVDPAGHLKSGLVVAYLGRRLHVRVKAQSEVNDIQELQKAVVYDGSGPGQKMIALKALKGARTTGTSAWFHWIPTTPGLHRLTAQLLEPQDDATKGDNTAKLSVIVVRAPGDVNGDGAVDALDTETIREQIGRPTAESTCGTACDLNGDGHIGPADLELAMAHCDNAHCAISHTLPLKRKEKLKK